MTEVEKTLAGKFAGLDDTLRRPAPVPVAADRVRLRPLFTVLAGQVGPRPDDPALVTAATVVELIHLATLCHGRIRDEGPVSRPSPGMSVRRGHDIDILTGDYLSAHASVLVSTLGPDAARIVAETFATVVTGQMRAKFVTQQVDSVANYLHVAREKTATLISACCRFGGMFSGASGDYVEQLARFGAVVGTVVHISDDLAGAVPAFAGPAGIEESVRQQLHQHADLADTELSALPDGAGVEGLRRLVRHLVERAV
ncbi:polyprenyl synthetase family protein [Nocardia sp. CDC186]|uniref:Polyprenyl synthetase family protein n=1 Tax=Nocardia implantans TaxID=3108168 RepID=A0ABU6AZS7_9NOCA|nr:MULTISPECIES: polyprenyl synthetase family protein [unclassified Nocardia]MBF6191362.1 polyprenyl synthetase family protein [Nocardia beijingensis]MEA3533003.1 polyprenyl synthetase family protein [Nocardia sp. CDC192]MEB3512935.1 polyprenyl synthetase family protein [Nocardia sp. CDC186]